MNMVKIGNLFSNNAYNIQKTNTKSGFANALQEQLESTEAKKAENMTAAVNALDKALEKAENENKLSKAQADWLRNRYDSEEHVNLLNDLYELGILSERDMEILNSKFLMPLILPENAFGISYDSEGNTGSWFTKIDGNASFSQRFFNEIINPNWRSDIIGYYRAKADNDLEIFKVLERKNMHVNPMGSPTLPPNNSWYEESAEVRNRLADILEQIFNS